MGIVAGFEASEDLVKGMQQDTALVSELTGTALPGANEVVNEDVEGL